MKVLTLAFAILIGSAFVAAAIVFVFRWEISSGGQLTAYRLDRWTGAVVPCHWIGPRETSCRVPDDWEAVPDAPAPPKKGLSDEDVGLPAPKR